VSKTLTFERSRVLALLGASAACSAFVYIVALLAPLAPLHPVPSFVLAFTCVAAEIVLLSRLAPALPLPICAPWIALCGALLVGLASRGVLVSAGSAALLTFALGSASALLGATLGARIEQPGQLAAVAMVSAVADLWSVFDSSAPSARFAAEALAEPDKLAVFALPFALLGTALIAPVIGAGDIVFTALYIAAYRAHGLSVRRLTYALAVAYAIALLGLLLLLRPLPLLPLLGVAAIATEPAARSLTRREWRTVGAVCAALLIAVALLRSR
jgi:hypothetical protein